jgi:hypothetical protein
VAVIISMPTNVPEAVSTGYQRQNEISRMIMSGHLRISFSNMDNTGAPKVLAYSVFEANDALYKTLADETPGGSPSSGYNYVYAVPGTGGVSFQYSAVKPVWNAAKGGWYNGNNRAVLEFYYYSGGYEGKRIMDIYNYNIADKAGLQIPPDSATRALVYSKTTQGEASTTLGPGLYEARMRGGLGGKGGQSYSTSQRGDDGEPGGVLSGFFEIKNGTRTVYVEVGGNGEDGKDGNADGDGGNGGKCDGGGGGGGEGKDGISPPGEGRSVISGIGKGGEDSESGDTNGYALGGKGGLYGAAPSRRCPVRTSAGKGGNGGNEGGVGTTHHNGGGGGGGGGSTGISDQLVISGGRQPSGSGAAVEIYRVAV